MKKIISILLVLSIIVVSFCGCDNIKGYIKTNEVSETQDISDKKEEIRKYIPNPFELKDRLINYFESCGYSFDDWYVIKDTPEVYLLGTEDGGRLYISEDNFSIEFMVPMEYTAENRVEVDINDSTLGTFWIEVSSGLFDVYEIYNTILSDCPDELKIGKQEINDQFDAIGKIDVIDHEYKSKEYEKKE